MSAPQEEVEQRFSCDHVEWSFRRKTTSNGAVHYRKQCHRCGEGKVVKKVDVPDDIRDSLQEVDEEIAQRWWRARSDAYREAYDQQRQKENEAWRAAYTAHLASPEWRRRRKAVLKRSNGICEGCAENIAEHVHHLTYARVGRELLFDLVAVCTPCHAVAHAHLDQDAQGIPLPTVLSGDAR